MEQGKISFFLKKCSVYNGHWILLFRPVSVLKATKSFESLLIPQLPRSPPDVEAMRIYLILSECPALHDSKNYIRLTIPLAMAILRLDANPSKVLGTACGRITL